MGATLRDDPNDRLQYRTRDFAHERWGQRMSISMMAATALHAAVFGMWPMGGGSRINLFQPPAPVEPGPPTFISMVDLPQSSDALDGTVAIPMRSGDAPLDVAAEDERAGVPESLEAEELRDRLVRGASYVPTVSDNGQFQGGSGGPTVDKGNITVARGVASGTNDPNEFETLKGLSAIDLERLNALRPDVALEAASNWVLLRNPSDVWEYMRRNSSPSDKFEGSVQVALWVSAAGSVEWAEVVGSSGKQDLDDIALNLFSKVVTFRPARLQGVPQPMSAVFTVNFPWY